MSRAGQHLALIVGMLDLFQSDDFLFQKDLDCVVALVVYRLNCSGVRQVSAGGEGDSLSTRLTQVNSSETARPQSAIEGKVAQGVSRAFGLLENGR